MTDFTQEELIKLAELVGKKVKPNSGKLLYLLGMDAWDPSDWRVWEPHLNAIQCEWIINAVSPDDNLPMWSMVKKTGVIPDNWQGAYWEVEIRGVPWLDSTRDTIVVHHKSRMAAVCRAALEYLKARGE